MIDFLPPRRDLLHTHDYGHWQMMGQFGAYFMEERHTGWMKSLYSRNSGWGHLLSFLLRVELQNREEQSHKERRLIFYSIQQGV